MDAQTGVVVSEGPQETDRTSSNEMARHWHRRSDRYECDQWRIGKSGRELLIGSVSHNKKGNTETPLERWWMILKQLVISVFLCVNISSYWVWYYVFRFCIFSQVVVSFSTFFVKSINQQNSFIFYGFLLCSTVVEIAESDPADCDIWGDSTEFVNLL